MIGHCIANHFQICVFISWSNLYGPKVSHYAGDEIGLYPVIIVSLVYNLYKVPTLFWLCVGQIALTFAFIMSDESIVVLLRCLSASSSNNWMI